MSLEILGPVQPSGCLTKLLECGGTDKHSFWWWDFEGRDIFLMNRVFFNAVH